MEISQGNCLAYSNPWACLENISDMHAHKCLSIASKALGAVIESWNYSRDYFSPRSFPIFMLRVLRQVMWMHPHLQNCTACYHNTKSLSMTPSVSQPDNISPYNMFYFTSHQPRQPFFICSYSSSSGCDQYLHTGTFC